MLIRGAAFTEPTVVGENRQDIRAPHRAMPGELGKNILVTDQWSHDDRLAFEANDDWRRGFTAPEVTFTNRHEFVQPTEQRPKWHELAERHELTLRIVTVTDPTLRRDDEGGVVPRFVG